MKIAAQSLFFVSALATLSLACSVVDGVEITFYGFPDNDPPGAGTAYNCGGRNNIAGGTGTFDDPLTFASDPNEYSQCEIIYLPYLKKYLRMEDECAQCETDWANGKAHVDIWTGSSTVNGGSTQEDCENSLTPDGGQEVLRQPASTYTVDWLALYSKV
ncbi:MAG: hypothetical protein M1820_005809 [Bogoriella megaspora]|nr:MAG: hypothetical protein M1820_005809 [Bogoriella megaspora]